MTFIVVELLIKFQLIKSSLSLNKKSQLINFFDLEFRVGNVLVLARKKGGLTCFLWVRKTHGIQIIDINGHSTTSGNILF